MIVVLRVIAWLLAAAVTFATLGPPSYRPHSNLGQDAEHTLAFVLVGLAFGLAYPRNRPSVAGASVVMIGVLELLQLLVPARTDGRFHRRRARRLRRVPDRRPARLVRPLASENIVRKAPQGASLRGLVQTRCIVSR